MNTTSKSDTGMSQLISLPAELLGRIGSFLDPTDVANLRFTCFRAAQVFKPFLVNLMTVILIDRDRPVGAVLKATSSKGRAVDFSHIPAALAPYLQTLNILIRYKPQPSIIALVEEKLVGLTTLRCFKLLWTIYPGRDVLSSEELANMETIEEKLLLNVFNANQRTLETLQLDGSLLFPRSTTSHWVSNYFSSLKKIIFSSDEQGCLGFFSQLKHVLAEGSVLEHLEVTLTSRYGEEKLFIQDFLPSRSLATGMALRTLLLRGNITWSSNHPVTATFSHLSRLTIIHIGPYGSHSLDGFWNFLRSTNIQLRFLRLESEITSALVMYLTSFRGIEELELQPRADDRGMTMVEGLSTILVSHAPTLQRILLQALDRDLTNERLSFSTFWPSGASFRNLRYLYTRDPIGWIFGQTTCQGMLDWLEQFPALEHVSTDWGRGSPDGQALSEDDIRRKLVARTGRPKYWSCTTSRVRSSLFTWKIQPQEDDRWTFVKIPYLYDDNVKWQYD